MERVHYRVDIQSGGSSSGIDIPTHARKDLEELFEKHRLDLMEHSNATVFKEYNGTGKESRDRAVEKNVRMKI